MATSTKSTKTAVGKPTEFFKPDYDDMLDQVERKFKLGQGSMNKDARATSQISTGLLCTDLLLGGGILPGAWYTVFGGEGSAKSTHLAHIKIAAADSGVPIMADYDYEGCHTADTTLSVNGVNRKFSDLVDTSVIPDTEGPMDVLLEVDSVGRTSVKARAYYGGFKPVTRIETETGTELKGHNHPVLVKTPTGPQWRKIEDLQVGDVIYQKRRL